MPYVENVPEFIERQGGNAYRVWVAKYKAWMFRNGAWMSRDGETRVDPPEDDFARLRNQVDYTEQRLIDAKNRYKEFYSNLGEVVVDDSEVKKLKRMAKTVERIETGLNVLHEERDKVDPRRHAEQRRAEQEAERSRLLERRRQKLQGLPVFAASADLDEN